MPTGLCIRNMVQFLLQILTVAVTVSLWYRQRPVFHHSSSITEFEIDTCKLCVPQ
ncbi:hypothetical protein EXN66_Car019191 [Channa argus]|uniref:Uncharacterized protein n=1 Tax=Channa argus TaxID=215402 RepID=A0A6G1QMG7_CHAAH|nr:hypothetical protein EXN66_Car019191 [Channa argus]